MYVDLQYIQCALDDKPGADIRQFFTDTIAFMEEAEAKKGKVLIHCQMGMRSVSLSLGVAQVVRFCFRDRCSRLTCQLTASATVLLFCFFASL